jgi:hypothetical protein
MAPRHKVIARKTDESGGRSRRIPRPMAGLRLPSQKRSAREPTLPRPRPIPNNSGINKPRYFPIQAAALNRLVLEITTTLFPARDIRFMRSALESLRQAAEVTIAIHIEGMCLSSHHSIRLK